MLHLSVIVHFKVRGKSSDNLRHLLIPLAGVVLLSWVVIKANVAAQRVGIVWTIIGLALLVLAYLTGRKPKLSGL